MNPYVREVEPLEDYRLRLLFENGERRILDMRPYLDRGVFQRLRDRGLFQEARVVAGSVEWPTEIDLSYDTLYLQSVPESPQEVEANRGRADESP